MSADSAQGILDRLRTLDEHQVRMLHGMWQGMDAATRTRAWRRGTRALDARHESQLLEEAKAAVARWVRDYASGTMATPYELDQSFRDSGRLDGRIAAAPAILDAMLATLAADALDPAEHEELLGPWLVATGPPAPDDPAWQAPDDLDDPDDHGDAR